MLLRRREEVPCGDHRVVAELIGSLESGATPLVLLNGLSDTLEAWDPFIESLASFPDFLQHPILRMDFRGQGASLALELSERGSFAAEPTVYDQLLDVHCVLDHFGIRGKVLLIGSSYGGGVALKFAASHAERVEKSLLFVPYVIRLDQAHPLSRVWTQHLEWFGQMGTLSGVALDLGRRQYRNFLNHYMDYRYGHVLADPLARQAAIKLTFGIMGYNALKDLSSLPERALHLVSVGQDTLVPPALYDEFWSRLPEKARASWLHIADGEHLILQQAPEYCALWARKVLRAGSAPEFADGRRFDSDLRARNTAV